MYRSVYYPVHWFKEQVWSDAATLENAGLENMDWKKQDSQALSSVARGRPTFGEHPIPIPGPHNLGHSQRQANISLNIRPCAEQQFKLELVLDYTISRSR